MNILLTGSTGYVGRRLEAKLLEDPSVRLRLFVRNAKKVGESARSKVEVTEGDSLNREALDGALKGIDCAYYLIHSMGSGEDFAERDRISAANFRDACIAAGVKRIIYLGGLGVKGTASEHLLSRLETGEILSAKPEAIQTIWFRAGIIIGSGSASFEIVRNLAQKLPVMITPRWVKTKTEPIAIRDVLSYLVEAKDLAVQGNLIVDIGSEQMSFKEMLQRTAQVMGLKRIMLSVPLLSPRLSSYWLVLFTPVSFGVASALVEGLKSETIRQNDHAERYFPDIKALPFEEAIKKALAVIEKNQVLSRWCDSSAGPVCDVDFHEEIADAVYIDEGRHPFGGIPPHRVFMSVKSIGGKAGWFTYDFLWEMRGLVDKLLGGYGINRGRRDDRDLRIGDKLDFWKVVDLKEDTRLLLEADMKVPGKAWLEFTIEGNTLVRTAYFYPQGIWGRAYWYATKPFHFFVFADLAKNIIERARDMK